METKNLNVVSTGTTEITCKVVKGSAKNIKTTLRSLPETVKYYNYLVSQAIATKDNARTTEQNDLLFFNSEFAKVDTTTIVLYCKVLGLVTETGKIAYLDKSKQLQEKTQFSVFWLINILQAVWCKNINNAYKAKQELNKAQKAQAQAQAKKAPVKQKAQAQQKAQAKKVA